MSGLLSEFRGEEDSGYRTKRPTDYVIRTMLSKETCFPFEGRSENKDRVQLILRFRSMLTRRGKSMCTIIDQRSRHLPAVRLPPSADTIAKRVQSVENSTKQLRYASTFGGLTSRRVGQLSTYNSDSCLLEPKCTLHLKATTGQLSLRHWPSQSGLAPSSSEYADGRPRSGSTSEKLSRMQSLSTGNVCCMFALRCTPSVELLAYPTQPNCPVQRTYTMPCSSLKSREIKRGGRMSDLDPHALERLKDTFCYQDTKNDLSSWIQQTMTKSNSPDSNASGNSLRGDYIETMSGQLAWSRHVRFADETTRSPSMTTLNSLSASSSTRSLTSLVQSSLPNSHSETVIQQQTTNFLTPPNCPVCIRSPLGHSSRLLTRKFSLPTSKPPPSEICKETESQKSKSASLAHRLWKKKKPKHHKGVKAPPMVTVNVIQNYEEPPEVPDQAFRELHLQAYEPHWEKTFVNPADCNTFQRRLFKQRVCLGRLWSIDTNSVGVEVHFISTRAIDEVVPVNVCLRYSLDSWETYEEFKGLERSHCERQNCQTSEDRWMEVYAGTVVLTDKKKIAIFRRFEFAVVARIDGQEFWDNNEKNNYICLWRTEEN